MHPGRRRHHLPQLPRHHSPNLASRPPALQSQMAASKREEGARRSAMAPTKTLNKARHGLAARPPKGPLNHAGFLELAEQIYYLYKGLSRKPIKTELPTPFSSLPWRCIYANEEAFNGMSHAATTLNIPYKFDGQLGPRCFDNADETWCFTIRDLLGSRAKRASILEPTKSSWYNTRGARKLNTGLQVATLNLAIPYNLRMSEITLRTENTAVALCMIRKITKNANAPAPYSSHASEAAHGNAEETNIQIGQYPEVNACLEASKLELGTEPGNMGPVSNFASNPGYVLGTSQDMNSLYLSYVSYLWNTKGLFERFANNRIELARETLSKMQDLVSNLKNSFNFRGFNGDSKGTWASTSNNTEPIMETDGGSAANNIASPTSETVPTVSDANPPNSVGFLIEQENPPPEIAGILNEIGAMPQDSSELHSAPELDGTMDWFEGIFADIPDGNMDF